MIQVTLIAYMTAGAFLGLAYFDYFYHLMVVVVVLHHLLRSARADSAAAAKPVEPLSLLGAWRRTWAVRAPPGPGGVHG
jgi:hypothetical protein